MKLIKLALPLLVLFSLLMISACDDRSMELSEYEIDINATPTTIYADNGITYSEVQVLVKDDEHFAITNQEVTFSSSIGHMIYKVNTDSSGVATSTFWDTGVTGTAVINAYVGKAVATVDVTIDSIPEVTELSFYIEEEITDIDAGQMRTFEIVARNINGYVADGTMISFVCEGGKFTDLEGTSFGNSIQVETNNGSADIVYKAGTTSGVGSITGSIGTQEDTITLNIHPSSPSAMYMVATPDTIGANSGEVVIVEAHVADKYGNPVENNVRVEFTTDIGSVAPFSETDENGIAYANFSAGAEAGVALVEAVADSAAGSVVITIVSDDVNAIEFLNDEHIAIDVQGTGGNESAALTVALKDMNDNIVSDEYDVTFELISAPLGVNINNSGSEATVASVNGQATVSVNSGYVSGNVTVKATCVNDIGTVISSTMNTIIVQAGPPSSVEFTMGGVNEGENIGAGAWSVQIAALITDEWNNPVKNGTTVFFSIEDNPNYATIETETAHVGNFNADQDSIPGMAFSSLSYDGAHTNDLIIVRLEIGLADSIFVDQAEFALPLQQGSLTMTPVPAHFEWTENIDPEYFDAEMRVMLRDGQNNQINGQVISFETSAGFPLEPTPSDTGDPYTGITGPGTGAFEGQDGMLFKYVRLYKYEFPPPIPSAQTITVEFIALILGTDVEANASIAVTRTFD